MAELPTPLIVDGGGADEIQVRDSGRLIVKSTSAPLSFYNPVGGVYDILLGNKAQLLYLDGVTELIAINGDAIADLKGGSINYIKSMQYTNMTGADPHINIFCLPGHSWINGNPLKAFRASGGMVHPLELNLLITPNLIRHGQTSISSIPNGDLVLLAAGGLLLRRQKP